MVQFSGEVHWHRTRVVVRRTQDGQFLLSGTRGWHVRQDLAFFHVRSWFKCLVVGWCHSELGFDPIQRRRLSGAGGTLASGSMGPGLTEASGKAGSGHAQHINRATLQSGKWLQIGRTEISRSNSNRDGQHRPGQLLAPTYLSHLHQSAPSNPC